MSDWIRYTVTALTLVLALAAYIDFRRSRFPGTITTALLWLGAAAVLAQGVVTVTEAGGHRMSEPATFWGYLATTVILLPAGAYVARVERSRWSSLAIAVVALVIAVLEVRMHQLWTR